MGLLERWPLCNLHAGDNGPATEVKASFPVKPAPVVDFQRLPTAVQTDYLTDRKKVTDQCYLFYFFLQEMDKEHIRQEHDIKINNRVSYF